MKHFAQQLKIKIYLETSNFYNFSLVIDIIVTYFLMIFKCMRNLKEFRGFDNIDHQIFDIRTMSNI